MKKATNRDIQAAASKKLFLETASRLTSEMGFENVTVQAICKAAGMSVGAFYHHFNSKEEIILAWYGLSDEYFELEVIPRLLQMDADVSDKAAEFAREQIGFGKKYGKEYIKQLYRAQIAYNNTEFFSSERSLVKGLISLIDEGQKKGVLQNDASAAQIAGEVLVLIRGVILNWLWNGTDDPQEDAANMVKQYLKAYHT